MFNFKKTSSIETAHYNGLTGKERHLSQNDIIVSKTDLQGRILYANQTFIEISGYKEVELIGKPHSIIRHPDMPRAVFKLLWDTISRGNEIFAYVVNRCKNGDHYWVLATVTPTYSNANELTGYHSCRRAPRPDAIEKIIPIYRKLCEIENQPNHTKGLADSLSFLQAQLASMDKSYDCFIHTL